MRRLLLALLITASFGSCLPWPHLVSGPEPREGGRGGGVVRPVEREATP
jgi:hypothetical protein